MFRTVFRALTTVAIVAATIGFLASGADARIGGGLSSGSRGTRTFSAPPATSTMPSAAPMQRTVTQPNVAAPRPGLAPSPGGFFGRSGFWGGLAAGFLGAGLFGLLFGHGMMGGLGGIVSFLGLIFQLGLIALVAMFLWRWFQRRSQPAYAGSLYRNGPPASPLGAIGLGGGQGEVVPAPASAATKSASRAPTTMRSSTCSARFRPPTATRTSMRCGPTPRLKWCLISPRIWRRMRAAAS
jgi:hypothetical protein